MKKVKKNNSKKSPVLTILFFGTTLITLYFNPSLQDPFNPPKLWILMIIASLLIGYLLFQGNETAKNDPIIKKLIIIVFFFLLFGIISVLFSPNKTISILGEFQRKNGFVTYLSLSIIMLTAAKYINLNNIKRLLPYILFISIILTLYGFMQHFGKDFVSWNNPYNSVIGTAGNPNFSSAIYAILCSFLFAHSLSSYQVSIFHKIYFPVLAIIVFIGILFTNSRQGILAFALGSFVIIYFKAFYFNKILSRIILFSFSLITFFSVMGMLKRGPLESLLYKDSVSVRGFYWRTGFEMLKQNPFTGVGLDNYGSFFNFYRNVEYPLRYGFDVTSSNAHNVFIQNFATGGIFFGLIYIFLQFYILFYGIKLIKKSNPEDRLIIIAVFASWVTYQAQSFVSIDNISIAIWGWLLGGILIGLNSQSEAISSAGPNRLSTSREAKQVITSFTIGVIVFIFCTLLYRGESGMYKLRGTYNPSNSESNSLLYVDANKLLKIPFLDINYKNQIAIYLATTGYASDGIDSLKTILKSSSNSIDTLNVLSNIYESAKDPKSAIKYREELVKLNPYNAKNYLQLGKNYRDIGDFVSMDLMLTKIQSFAPETDIYKIAKAELIRP